MDARPHGADESAEDHPAEPADSLADDLPTGDSRGPGSDPLPHDGSGSADTRGGPGPDGRPEGPDDTDAQWQDLVARLRAMGDPDPEVLGPDTQVGGASTLSSGRDTGAPAPGGRPTRDDDGRPVGDAPPPAGPVAPRGWSPEPAVEEAESHFEPPDPGPVLGGDPLLTLAWTAVVSVPLALLLVVMLWPDAPAVVLHVAGAVFACGLGLLLWRMPRGDDDESRGSGAVV